MSSIFIPTYYSKWFRFLTFMFRTLFHNDLDFLHLSWGKALISLFCRCMSDCLCTTFYSYAFSLKHFDVPVRTISLYIQGFTVGSLFYSIVLCFYPFACTILGWVLQICALCNQHVCVQSCCPVVVMLWLFRVPRNFTVI